ncbi:DUF402 domain-containing protein [Sinomonas sp. ASV322]|uniref:DUF402 domain-containing protein n=1 Tax=Sinomonas sp. ASV322 TaxID=3041920 RepID=UPI0027DE3097|nr:DUF402 domain-containing protein [Sinomonas sp. ASV322]MDQ4500879.1 DUF402 domain-containing protein [Sinomonas sp. ASV322]
MSSGAKPDSAAWLDGDLPRQGELVVARNRKWDGSAHWVVPGFHLGEDEHGAWIYQGRGEFISRPGVALHTLADAVLLVPREGKYAATFYDDENPGEFRIYVDLAWDLAWRRIRAASAGRRGAVEFHMIDMDLDVIRSATRGVFVDDEDEFEEHAASMAYPEWLVGAVRDECARLYEAVRNGTGPFGGAADAWLARGRQHTREDRS